VGFGLSSLAKIGNMIGDDKLLRWVDPGTSWTFRNDPLKLYTPKGVQQPTAPQAPTINQAEAKAQDTADELRRRRGMAATILAGQPGDTQPVVNAARLLGS
jgi:hypothetical protein